MVVVSSEVDVTSLCRSTTNWVLVSGLTRRSSWMALLDGAGAVAESVFASGATALTKYPSRLNSSALLVSCRDSSIGAP